MDISRYLAVLIRDRQELVVTGLGTFYKEDIPARYDAASNSFLPPTEVIRFKQDFIEDNTLLNYIVSEANTDLSSAANYLKEYINNLNDLLGNTEQIRIDALGTFEKFGESFRFDADAALLSNTHFGLKPQPEIANTMVERAEIVQPEIDEAEEEQPKSRKWILWLFIFLLAGGAAATFFYYPELFNTQSKNNTVIPSPVAPAIQQDSLAQTDSTKMADTAKTDTVDTLALKPANIESSYEIIVAAFGKRSEAEQYIRQLEKRGITAHALENKPKEFIKISVGTFSDEKLAQTELKRIQSELSSSAWIHHIKPIKNQ